MTDSIVSDRTLKRIALALAALTLLTFVRSLGNNFVGLDDSLLIYKNPAIQSFTFDNIQTVFTSYDPELYVPLTLLSYQLEHAIFGLNPFIYHFTNLALHIGSVVLLFFIILHLARNIRTRANNEAFTRVDTAIAFTVAILFAIHPLQTEAVAWASARKDVLSACLFFASILSYLRFRITERKSRYAWSIVFFALALLSKVSVIALPIVLLMIDLLMKRKINSSALKEKIPYFALSLLFGIIALFGKTSQIRALTILEQILLAAKASVFYLQKLILPWNLSVFYPEQGTISFTQPAYLISIIVVLALVGLMFGTFKKHRVISFGILFYFVMLAPSWINFWKNGNLYFASDRYAYIAMIGIVFALATLLIPKIISIRRAPLGGAVIAAVLSIATIVQANHWRDSEALYRKSLTVYPSFAPALNNLGSALFEKGEFDAAMEQYERALLEDPHQPIVHINIGNLRTKLGDMNGAMLAFEEAVKAIPTDRPLVEDDLAPYYFLGNQYDIAGRREEAIALFEKAADIGFNYADAHYNLAVMYQKYRRPMDARRELEIYVTMKPKNLEARYRLSAVQAETGAIEEAIANLRYVVDKDPNYERAWEHLQNLLRIQK